jgi:hemolysin activation/secretion protein
VPDGEFISWLGQAQYVRRLDLGDIVPSDVRLVLRAEAQLTDDRLLPLEKFAIGGADSVRGFREDLLVRDNGWAASAEVRVPVLELSLPFVPADLQDGRIEIAPFVDVGQSWNTDIDDPSPKTIASVGIGLRWAPVRGVLASLYWAHALRDIDDPADRDLQDDGIHFSIRLTAF